MEKEENEKNKENATNGAVGAQEQEPPKEIPLFRTEALQHKKGNYLGKAVIISPISFSIWTLGLSLIAVALALFLYFGKYTKKQSVTGVLTPNKGLIGVYARIPGVVTTRFVHQGDKVTKEQILYLISTEQHNLSEQGFSEQQVEIYEKQIAIQKNRLAIAEKNLGRYKQLLDQRFISEMDYQKGHDEYLSSKLGLHSLEQKLGEVKNAGNYAIRAPADGVISTLIAMIGDHVTGDKPLASIIPVGALFQGILFVPTEKIGFVKIGQKVLLQYDAYPYQNFGLYESTVSSIDKSVLLPTEINMPSLPQNLPFYRVIVDLKQQTVMVYGKPYPLTSGMTLKGSILGDKRNIWQWLLEPIYSFRGSLTSS